MIACTSVFARKFACGGMVIVLSLAMGTTLLADDRYQAMPDAFDYPKSCHELPHDEASRIYHVPEMTSTSYEMTASGPMSSFGTLLFTLTSRGL